MAAMRSTKSRAKRTTSKTPASRGGRVPIPLDEAERVIGVYGLEAVQSDLHAYSSMQCPLPEWVLERIRAMMPDDAPDEVWDAFDELVRSCVREDE
jgi:hypothetical protein